MKAKSIAGRDPSSGKVNQIVVADGRIQSIRLGPARETSWLSPGFIDLQVNGYLGSDVNSDAVDPDAVIALTRKMSSIGVTTFLPTIITASETHIIKALQAVAEARRASPAAAHAIPFVHVEGPHISAEDGPRGAHPAEHVRPPSLREFERWQEVSANLVGLVTISPHWENTLEYILAIVRKGATVSIGHSHATPDQIHAAADAGATLATHLGNGVGSSLPRHPNLLWAQLADDRLTATFIADGHHLPTDTLKAMLRAKGIERSVLISDVVSVGGMPPGKYETAIDGPVVVTSDGRVVSVKDTRFLAGAYLPLIDGIAHAAGIDGVSLGDAIRMATENPGRFAGCRGALCVGAVADLVHFDWDGAGNGLRIRDVLMKGALFEG